MMIAQDMKPMLRRSAATTFRSTKSLSHFNHQAIQPPRKERHQSHHAPASQMLLNNTRTIIINQLEQNQQIKANQPKITSLSVSPRINCPRTPSTTIYIAYRVRIHTPIHRFLAETLPISSQLNSIWKYGLKPSIKERTCRFKVAPSLPRTALYPSRTSFLRVQSPKVDSPASLRTQSSSRLTSSTSPIYLTPSNRGRLPKNSHRTTHTKSRRASSPRGTRSISLAHRASTRGNPLSSSNIRATATSYNTTRTVGNPFTR